MILSLNLQSQLPRLELLLKRFPARRPGGLVALHDIRRAEAQSADYDARTRELILTGEPRLFDRGDVLVGERIAMALDSHEVRVERAHGRLRPEAHQDEARPGAKR